MHLSGYQENDNKHCANTIPRPISNVGRLLNILLNEIITNSFLETQLNPT